MLLIVTWYFFIIIFGLGLGLNLQKLVSASASASRFWLRLTSLLSISRSLATDVRGLWTVHLWKRIRMHFLISQPYTRRFCAETLRIVSVHRGYTLFAIYESGNIAGRIAYSRC